MRDLPAVRLARPDEGELVRSIVAAQGLPLTGLDQAWVVLVVEVDAAEDRASEVVGVAALERHGTPADYLLRSVAVVAERRGAGLGSALVGAALSTADADAGGHATVGLLTETADGYFGRFGFRPVSRAQLPAALDSSPELGGACPDTARAYLRSAPGA